jgi:hypothetical protein
MLTSNADVERTALNLMLIVSINVTSARGLVKRTLDLFTADLLDGTKVYTLAVTAISLAPSNTEVSRPVGPGAKPFTSF